MKSVFRIFFITAALAAVALGAAEWALLRFGLVTDPAWHYSLFTRFMPVTCVIFAAAAALLNHLLSGREREETAALEAENEELLLAIEDLRGDAEKREEFMAGFAHELKTPLTAVIGYADMLRSRDMSAKQRFTAAGYIFSEGRRLEALSKKLMDIIVLGRTELELKHYDAGYFIREVAAVVVPSTGERGLQLDIFWDKGEVDLEPDLFKTLLINLVDNARKASRRGQKIELFGKREAGGYAFYVRDSGQGIPPGELVKITEAFYMVDKSRARAENGAGLGLALCQRIALLHGSSLEFTSEPGEGTTVRIFLKEAA